MKRVKKIVDGKDLYTAAEKVFRLPPLQILNKGAKAAEVWRKEIANPFEPDIYFEASGKEILIVLAGLTQTVTLSVKPLINAVTIEFCPEGSKRIAKEILVHLKNLPRRSMHLILVEFADGKIENLGEICRHGELCERGFAAD